MTHPSELKGIKEFKFELEKAYIYFLVEDNKVIYVGQSISFLGRYTAHSQNETVNKRWYNDKVISIESQLKHFDECYILEVENSKDSLNHWEQHYIRKYLPIYNTCHHSRRIREEIKAEKRTVKKFLIDNNLNHEIERINDKWLIQAN